MDKPYTGTALRSAVAHYGSRPPPPGLNADHMKPDPEPDPFNPVPDTPPDQAGTVWSDPEAMGPTAGQSNFPNLAQAPVSHWYDGQPAVPSGEPYGRAQQAMQERLMVDHADTNYVPDGIRLYQHWSEGQENDFIVGRAPVAAGATIPDGPLAGLQNGRNGYDATNVPNEVYSAGESNVGRYRLGVKTNMWGIYSSPLGKFGQDANLRAYTGLSPAFPFDKTPMTDTAPYTPNSTGTTHWTPATPAQKPSLFGLPSETSVTDYTVASAGGNSQSEFEDRSGGFF